MGDAATAKQAFVDEAAGLFRVERGVAGGRFACEGAARQGAEPERGGRRCTLLRRETDVGVCGERGWGSPSLGPSPDARRMTLGPREGTP